MLVKIGMKGTFYNLITKEIYNFSCSSITNLVNEMMNTSIVEGNEDCDLDDSLRIPLDSDDDYFNDTVMEITEVHTKVNNVPRI